MLPPLHLQPINVIIYNGPQGKSHLEASFALRCFQRLSHPNVATLRCRLAPQQVHQRFVQPGPLVLRSAPLKLPTPTTDRDRTVSRRSEPSSRAILIGEQPNPWDLLQPQDMTSRHRGAKPLRRCELLGVISLLSPEYLLSFERWPFHTETTGSLCSSFLPDRLVGLSVKRAYAIILLKDGYQSSRAHL